MSLSSAWNSPSSVILTAIVAANLLLPASRFLSGLEADADVARTPVPAPARSSDVPVAIEPVVLPAVAKRAFRPEPPAPAVCRAWGPFTEPAEAQSLAARLALDDDAFEVRASEVPAEPDYLVTVQVSREATGSALDELGRNGVDTFLMQRGEEDSVLSVGVFSARSRADAQRRRMTDLGYVAGVKTLRRARQVYHLLAEMPGDTRPAMAAAAACGDIAPAQQFL